MADFTGSPLTASYAMPTGFSDASFNATFSSLAGSAISTASSNDLYNQDGWGYMSPNSTPPSTPSQSYMVATPQRHSSGMSRAHSFNSLSCDIHTYPCTYNTQHNDRNDFRGSMAPLMWRSYPPPALADALGLAFLKDCTQHLPMDSGHWTLLRQLAAGGHADALHYLLRTCLKHEDPAELQARPQNAVRNVAGYLTKVIRQKAQLLQRRPDIVVMMNRLCASSSVLADQVDGRILQLLSENLPNQEGVAACQRFMALPPASTTTSGSWSGYGTFGDAASHCGSMPAMQSDFRCYVGHAAWVDDLLAFQ